MTQVAAVILAGGKAERLGGINKALLTLGDQRFIDLARTATAGCSPIFLSTGQARFEVPDGLIPVMDLEADYAGPLAGVAAAVDHLRGTAADLLLSLAVDTPLFPHDFLALALPLLDTAPCVIAAYRGQDYPTNGLWRLGGIADLPARVRAGTAPRSLRRLAEGLGAVRLDYAERLDFDPFRNANTPEDLEFLRDLALRRSLA